MNAQLRNDLVNSCLAKFVYFVLIAFFFAGMFAIQPPPRIDGRGIARVPFTGDPRAFALQWRSRLIGRAARALKVRLSLS